jgi:hypothetical protein
LEVLIVIVAVLILSAHCLPFCLEIIIYTIIYRSGNSRSPMRRYYRGISVLARGRRDNNRVRGDGEEFASSLGLAGRVTSFIVLLKIKGDLVGILPIQYVELCKECLWQVHWLVPPGFFWIIK